MTELSLLLLRIMLAWNFIGLFVLAITWADVSSPFTHFDTYGLLCPTWVYKRFTRLNYFGVGLVTLFFNLLCPLISILYWVYRFFQFICTVGRK